MRDSCWDRIRLKDVCTKIGSGATPRGGEKTYTQDGPIALIRSQNVYNNIFNREGLAFISNNQADELANVEVCANDILLNITGDSVARVCQVGDDALPARVNQHVAIIRPDSNVLNPGFLRYYLVSPEMQAKLLSWAGSGGTRNALTKKMIESFEVFAPVDIREQRAIAHILGTLDDKIEFNRRMNETLEAMARALFKSWFVDFDPVRAKMEGRDTGLPPHIAALFTDRLVPSELGEIPEGWVTFSLDELADHHSKTLAPFSSPDAEFEHYSIPAFDIGFVPAIELGSAIKSNKTLIPDNAVLLSKLNPEIKRVWIPEHRDSRKQICSTEFLVFTSKGPANRSVLYSLFTEESFRTMLQSMVTGTSKSHQRVPVRALKKRIVLSGTSNLFCLFDRLAAPNLRSVLENRAMSRTLSKIRDTLLPKLVSGEIRVRDAESFLERAL